MGAMPRQVFDSDAVMRLAPAARTVRVVRRAGKVKIKLRTPRALITYVCGEGEAEEVLEKLKSLKKEIIEI
jgi:hypothetical protein